MAPLPPRDQRHFWLRYQVEGYTEEIVHDFEDRLRTIFGRHGNRVHVLDFEGLAPEMRQDLAERLWMVYTRDDGQKGFVILALGLHTAEEIAEDGFMAYWSGNERVIPDKWDLRLLGGGRHLKRYAEGRKSGARLSGGHFIGRLAHHFGLVSDDGLRGLSVMTRELPLINMGELVKLNIYMEVGEDCAWVAPRLKRQQVAAAGAPKTTEGAQHVDEGDQAISAPVQAPQPPPPPLATSRTMPQRLGRLKEEIHGLRRDVRSLHGLVERSMTDQGRFSTWMISCMT
ncbi:hypothetical protein Tco_0500405, partial [Tanacetum coccineum]